MDKPQKKAKASSVTKRSGLKPTQATTIVLPHARGRDLWRKFSKARSTKTLPSLALTSADLMMVADAAGNTVAHLLAAANLDAGKLEVLFTPAVQSMTNHAGLTPRAFRIETHRMSYLFKAAKSGNFSDIKLRDTDFLLKLEDGSTIVHTAARWGNLDEIPKKWRTEAVLSAKNDAGRTPRQLAEFAIDWAPARKLSEAIYDECSIPDLSAVTTGQLMISIGPRKITLAHLLARRGALSRLPVQLLTYDMLMLRGGKGFLSVYEMARASRCHECIPPGLRKDLNEEFGIDE